MLRFCLPGSPCFLADCLVFEAIISLYFSITPFPEDFKLHPGFMGGYEKREIIVVAENKSSAAYKSQ
jgi:hypothetical protein